MGGEEEGLGELGGVLEKKGVSSGGLGGSDLVAQALVPQVVDAEEAVEAAGGDEGEAGVTLQPPHAARRPLQALQHPPWGGHTRRGGGRQRRRHLRGFILGGTTHGDRPAPHLGAGR